MAQTKSQVEVDSKAHYITEPLEVLTQRLVQRWLDQALTPEAARKRALENDIPNAELALANQL